MKALQRACTAALAYLWSGWGAIASLCLFFALWEWGAGIYGSLALPGPLEVFARLRHMLAEAEVWQALGISAWRALWGFALTLACGSLLGMLAGLSMTAAMMSRPLVTLLVGMPPIAWLVLAMLWFGTQSHTTPIFTVFIACFPVVFVAALQGTRTLDGKLRDMARAYRLPPVLMFTQLYLPHMLSYLFPAWITALGLSWKVLVMAEMLSTADGVGASLAISRAHLDTPTSMAWIVAVLGLLLAVEYLLLEPVKRRVERWREAMAD